MRLSGAPVSGGCQLIEGNIETKAQQQRLAARVLKQVPEV